MSTRKAWLLRSAAAAILTMAAGAAAQAQPGAPSPQVAAPSPQSNGVTQSSAAEVQEVVVTAQKRSEVITKTPLAVSVEGQGKLDRLQVTTANDLITTVPNLQISQNGFAIRGIGSNNAFSGYSTVATQIDGVYDPSSQVLSLGLFDVDRIEVLRGPQGTVYGRNATAGVVNIYSSDPKPTFGGYGDVQFGNLDSFVGRLAVNLPVNDKVLLRVSLFDQTDDGYGPKLAASSRYNSTDVKTARIKGLFKLTDDIQWRLSFTYGENKGTTPAVFLTSYNYYPQANLTTGTLGPLTVVPASGVNFGLANVKNNEMDLAEYAVRSRVDWRLPRGFSLAYIAGYGHLNDNGVDATSGVFTQANVNHITQNWSNELDLNYDAKRFNAVLGLYQYTDRQPSGIRVLNAGNTAAAPFNAVFNAFGATFAGTGPEPSTINAVDVIGQYHGSGDASEAVFGQGSYELFNNFHLIGGVRATWDTVTEHELQNVCLEGPVSPSAASATTCSTAQLAFTDDYNRPSAHFNNTSWKVGFDYTPIQDLFFYGTVSTGYRGGGLQASTNPVQYQSYLPETVTNYEAGVKSRLLQRRLEVSATVFDMDYSNLQVSSVISVPGIGPTAVTTNAAKATIAGLEFESTLRPTADDTIGFFATYLYARFNAFPNAPATLGTPDSFYNIYAPLLGYAAIPQGLADFTGNRLPNAPASTFRIDYSHRFWLPNDGQLTPSVDAYWQDKVFSEIGNYPQGKIPSYAKVDLNLRYDSSKKRYYVDLFARNVGDQKIVSADTVLWSSNVQSYAPPRTYGMRIGVNF